MIGTNISSAVLARFIAELDIPVTRQSIMDELDKHPDYYSLLAFSDVLNNYQVPNEAYRLNFEELKNIPLPFIAHYKGSEFVVVIEFDDEKVTIADGIKGSKTLSIDKFKRLYSGSILLAEKHSSSGERDHELKRRKELINNWRSPIGYIGLTIILLVYLVLRFDTFTIQTGLLIFFKTVGLITSVLLLIQSIDADNPLIQRLCGGDNGKDCNAILSSKAAKLNEYLSWSEVGFFYFAGTWLVLLFNNNSVPLIKILAILNLCCLPYTFYSIYYQWRVAKQWCVFCCTVQAVLWLEFCAFLPYLLNTIQWPNVYQWGNFIACMAIPFLVWVAIKPYLLQLKKVKPLSRQLRKLKYNKESFYSALKKQPKYIQPNESWSIVLGNTEANTIITMVSNPYCPPCGKTHQELDEWLASIDDMQVRIVFTANNDDSDIKTPVTRHLMALNELADKTIVKQALHDWYMQKQKNYEEWAKAYPVALDQTRFFKLEKQKEWCEIAEIRATPTVLVNGYSLPDVYRLYDIKYMLV